MFSFSAIHAGSAITEGRQLNASGYELIAFDAEKLNVFAAEVRYCEPHWHPAPELITVLAGRFTLAVGMQSIELTKGGMLYINAQEVHSLCAEEEGSTLVTVQFSSGLFDELHPAPDIDWCRPNGVTDSSDRIVHQRLKALIEHLIDDRAPFQRIAAIYLLLDALVTAGKPVGRVDSAQRDVAMIKKGIEFINQRFDQPLSLAEVAGYIGVSYSWFSRQFKKVSRHNFKEYLTLVRLNKARTLLKDTRSPITTISYACGFQEHKYLIAAFNKYCGLTPTEYRKRFVSRQNAIDSRLALGEDCLCLPLNAELLKRLEFQ